MKLPILLLTICLSQGFAADPPDAPPLRDRNLVGMEPMPGYGLRGEQWFHENRLTIKGSDVSLEKVPVSISKGKKAYSSSDGGFYTYRGTLRQADGRWQMELLLTATDYVGTPVDPDGKPIPPKPQVFDVTFLPNDSLVLDKVTYQVSRRPLSDSSLSQIHVSVDGEAEKFTEDLAARESDLAYRLSVRHKRKPPLTMRLYLHFQPTATPGEVRTQGQFVVGTINGPPYRAYTREKTLSHEEAVVLLRCIREQDIFNLTSDPPITAAEDVAAPTIGVFGTTLWTFERYQAKPPTVIPPLPKYTAIRRMACESGPAHEVFAAFNKHAVTLLP